MLLVNQLVGFGGFAEAASGISYSYVGHYNNNTDTNSHSNAFDIGAEAADRYIIVSIHSSNNTNNPTSVTIAGTSASIVQTSGATQATALGGAAHRTTLYIANVTTGAGSQTVAVTYAASTDRFTMAVWRATGLTSTDAAGVATGTTATSFTSGSVTSVAGGFAIIAATPGYIASGTDTSFSGTGLTEQYDQTQDSNVRALGGDAPTSGTTYSATGTYTGATLSSTVMATWGT